MPNGIRVNFFEDKRGSQRAVEMLIKKLAGKEFTTEFPMPDFDRVDPNPAVKDMLMQKSLWLPPAVSYQRATRTTSSPPVLPSTASMTSTVSWT